VLGIALIGPLVVGIALVLIAAKAIWPPLHNVPENPLTALMRSPRDTVLFFLVAVIAGGLREELQRAFLLTRFEQHLGGARLGLIVTSLAFGAGHALQGRDAAIATAALGLVWGWVYLRRRSAVAPVVSHAGFNSLEILGYLVVGSVG
jgi:CAAX protease family protein